MGILRYIDTPEDLRRVSRHLLPCVAAELRRELVAVASKVGGHFAGSLGAVELTIALHCAFDTPRDRIVWDVGHQAYGHKALTGRREGLPRIKRAGGPSGFLRRSESPYDVFGAGHAGTSVSAALGIAEALSRLGSDARVVAVIGDGAATAGISFEALNHAGHLAANLRVVFNDNGMSIAPNVGGLHATGRARDYFGALRLRYQGPVDGHDLSALLPAIEALRDGPGPAVLHVRTRKGAGYAPAEADPFGWHATAPFEIDSGRRATGPAARSWTHAFAEALADLADSDPRIVAITAAMPDGTGLDRFAARHPDRVYDVGIAEQHAVTFAAGLATEGLRPVCAIYSSFLQRAFDQIVHDVALQKLPVTFALDRAGLVGADGPTHHGLLDLTCLRAIPGLVVAAPRDAHELAGMLALALAGDRPFALRFPRGSAQGAATESDAKPLPVGCAERLRAGEDVALCGLGRTVPILLEVAERLAERGVSAAVLDARFVKPLDRDALLGEAARHGRLVTAEDHARLGGFGSAVCELVAGEAAGASVLTLGLPDRFVEHASQDEQLREVGLDAASIADRVHAWLAPRRRIGAAAC